MIDWDKLEAEQDKGFKEYAPEGRYTVKVEKVDIHIVGTNGSIAQDFFFEESNEYKFPKATHWLSTKNVGWRQWHNLNLMMLLGAPKDAAKKAVEACEAKDGNKASLINAYQATYDRLLAKKPEVEIDVWQDGKYSRGEFASPKVRMSRKEETKPAAADATDSILDDAEELALDKEELELPF